MLQERKFTIIPETIDGNYIGEYTYEQVVRASWCYLHGDIETIVGYDIFSLLKSELTPDEIENDHWVSDALGEGIYPCICMGRECTFFRWNNRHFHGLVVLNTDTVHYKDTLIKFNSKSSCI